MAKLGVQIAIIQDNQILLIQRSDVQMWGLPGGEIDAGETATQAAIREAKEETGLDVILTDFVGLYVIPAFEKIGLAGHVTVFQAKSLTGEILLQTNETIDAGFFHPDDLPEHVMWHHLVRIKDTFDSRRKQTVVRSQHIANHMPESVITRHDLYAFIAQSGLSPREFWYQYLHSDEPAMLEINLHST
jgi:8-oxo-dGTP pyrophosphatase MutT (NUDIX family)